MPVTPPRVIRAGLPRHPHREGASAVSTARHPERRVVLELTVLPDGSASDVVALDGGDGGYGEAAIAAARRFHFEPARRGSEAIAARIRYVLVFPEERSIERPPVATRQSGRGLAARRATDPGAAAPVTAAGPSRGAPPGEVTTFDDLDSEYGAVAEVEAPHTEPTRRRLDRRQISRVAGTRGDALRVVEITPGVAQTSDGDPRLRGSSADESAVFIEGMQVPLLYHFGGVTGIFPTGLLESVDVYPGNFSARYGRVSGGAIEIGVRDPARDRLHAVLDLSLIDSSVLVEGPVGDRAAIAVGARRSNVDLVFEQLVPDDAFSVVAAPVYWDYQGITSYRVSATTRARLLVYGAHDQLELVLSDPAEDDPALRGSVRGKTEFHHVQTELISHFERVDQRMTLSYGRTDFDQTLAELNAEFVTDEVLVRGDWSIDATRLLALNLGFDVEAEHTTGRYFGPRPPQNDGAPQNDSPLSTQRLVAAEARETIVNPAAYAELVLRPAQRVAVVPGLRFDYFGQLEQPVLDPRLSTRVGITPTTTLKSGIGWYTQRPVWWRVLPELGNADLEPSRSLQLSLGAEQQLTEISHLGIEGFYKRLSNRVVALENAEPPYFVNDGSGRAYGAEFSCEVDDPSGAFGYLAYTLSRSERRDRDGAWRPFDEDQTHILSAVGSYDLGRGWEVGGRFRLFTGSPTTPVIDAVYDATTGVYTPVYGATNSQRHPTRHQLDLRVEKQWRFGDYGLAAYLDLQNAYNSENSEGRRYNYDYTESESISGLPLFPNLGLRGEL